MDYAVDDVLARARDLGTDALSWWVKLGAPAGLDDLVRARGGVPDETLDVLALDLAGHRPGDPRDGLSCAGRHDLATVRDSHAVAIDVFGGDLPPEDQLRALADRGTEWTSPRAGAARSSPTSAIARSAPVGWPGGRRGPALGRCGARGAPRPRRVRRAARGPPGLRPRARARMALVKGRVQPSGPILRRAGFAAYGQGRSYRVRRADPTSASGLLDGVDEVHVRLHRPAAGEGLEQRPGRQVSVQ